jgi:PPOX class probable F420-dependent enzyme
VRAPPARPPAEHRHGHNYDRPVIDEGTDFGARVARHLREDVVVWLTTVTPSGAPLPAPVWFIWDGADLVTMYSIPGARTRNLAANPRVTLNFTGDGRGGDIVILAGEAAVVRDTPPVHADAAYVEKYGARIRGMGMTPETFASRYSEPVQIRFDRVRGH